MMFLNKQTVDEEEESIRQQISQCSDEQRQRIYREIKQTLKDPDTYAALNYGLVAGLHHLYLGKYLRTIIELSLFVLGVILLANDFIVGLVFVVSMVALELFELFRSQIIVQYYNNKLMRKILISNAKADSGY